MMRNPSYDANFYIFDFWATFGGKIGGASKPDLKVGPLGGPFGTTTILEFSGLNLPPLNKVKFCIFDMTFFIRLNTQSNFI